MGDQGGMVTGRILQRQLTGDFRLARQMSCLGKPGGAAAQAGGQGTPAAAHHLQQGWPFTAPCTAKARCHQDRHLISHGRDIFETCRRIRHSRTIDGMAATRQTL